MDHYNPISSTKSCEHVRTIDFSPLQRLWPLCNFSTFLRALTLPYTHHNHRHMLSEQQQEQRHNGHNGPSQRLHLVTANQKGQMRYSQQVSIILEVSFFHVLAQCHCFLKPFALIYAPLNRSPTIRNETQSLVLLDRDFVDRTHGLQSRNITELCLCCHMHSIHFINVSIYRSAKRALSACRVQNSLHLLRLLRNPPNPPKAPKIGTCWNHMEHMEPWSGEIWGNLMRFETCQGPMWGGDA